MAILKRGGNALSSQDQIDIRRDIGLGTAATVDVPASGDASSAQAVKGNDSRLTDARTPSGTAIAAATSKTTPVDADSLPISDSAASGGLKRLTWANVKATLKTYFDSLYVSLTGIKTINGQTLIGSGDLTVGGGSGATNLSYTASPTNGVVVSDTGTDATVPLSDGTNAGLMAPAQHAKLAGIGAGANVTSVAGKTGVVTLAAADLSDFSTAADARISAAAGVSVASLSGGKIPTTQLPDLAVVDYLGAVANQTAMLALSGQKGDWCTRTDLGTTWIITGSNPTLLASWTQLSYPAAPVTSVAGRTGAVTLSASDVSGLGTAAPLNVAASGNASTVQVVKGDDTRLTDARTPSGPGIAAATEDTTPQDADNFPLADSTASNALKRITWATIKSALTTAFNSVYASRGATTASGLTMSTARLLGRSTAATGAIEEITVGSGLTLSAGTLTASGGGGSPGGSDGQIQRNNAGSFAGSNISQDASGRITVAAGTQTAAGSALTLGYIANGSGQVISGLTVNATNTASAATSNLLSLNEGSINRLAVRSIGSTTVTSGNSSVLDLLASGVQQIDLGFALLYNSAPWYLSRITTTPPTGNWDGRMSFFLNTGGGNANGMFTAMVLDSDRSLTINSNAKLFGEAANVFAQRNGASAQTYNIYGTFTDASNYRRVSLTMTTAGVGTLAPQGAGTGASGNILVVSTGATTVSGLPSASTAGAGARAFVTDATSTTFLTTATGGGANAVPVVSNGTNWLIG